MSKQRYIKDSFWTDPYIEKLSPDYKLSFLYLLTNPLCNIAGVYEMRVKRMAYETGYDVEVIENILKKFVNDGKLLVLGDWIIIKNHLKHQNLGNLTAEGINRVIKETPDYIQSLFCEKILLNSKNEEYSVLVLKENDIPLTSPLQAPTNGAYSVVKLSKVKLSSIKEEKEKYGEFENVLLLSEEHKKLLEKLGENNTNLLIEELSGYMASTKKKYSSHYATLLNWARRKIQQKTNTTSNQRYIA